MKIEIKLKKENYCFGCPFLEYRGMGKYNYNKDTSYYECKFFERTEITSKKDNNPKRLKECLKVNL